MLKACLNSAVEERLILRNPATGCKLPKAEKKEMKVLTQEQLGSYLAAADKRGLLPMFFLELTTGLRKGELVPLLWSDVDTNNMTITISKQAYRTKGALTVQPPKTDNSMRKIALSEETMELLKQEHEKHPGNPYLFPVAGPGVFFARRSGLESRRPLPLAPLPSSAPAAVGSLPLAGNRWNVPPRFGGKAPSEDSQGCWVGAYPLP